MIHFYQIINYSTFVHRLQSHQVSLVMSMLIFGLEVIMDSCCDNGQGEAGLDAPGEQPSDEYGPVRHPELSSVKSPNLVTNPGVLEAHALEHPLDLLQLRCVGADLVTLPVGDRGEGCTAHDYVSSLVEVNQAIF